MGTIKRIYLFFILVLLTFGQISTCFASDKEPMRIGVAAALTGFAAIWGEAESNAARLAVEEFNTAGGLRGKPVKLVVEDTKSSSKGTVSAINKLTNIDQISIIVGPSWLDSYGGAVPIADRSGAFLFTPSAAIAAVQHPKKYPYVFCTWHRADQEARELLKHLKKTGQTELILFLENDPFWELFRRIILESAEDIGISIVKNISFSTGEKDFIPHLIKLKELKSDSMFFGLNDESALLTFLKQVEQVKLKTPLFGTEYLEGFLEVKAFDGLLDKVTIIAPKVEKGPFYSAYQKRYGTPPVFSASNSYDATRILLSALKEGHSSREEIRKYLLENTFETETFGTTRFDNLGGVTAGQFEIRRLND